MANVFECSPCGVGFEGEPRPTCPECGELMVIVDGTNLDFGQALAAMREGETVSITVEDRELFHRATKDGSRLERFVYSRRRKCHVWASMESIPWASICRTDWRIVPEESE